MKIPTLKQYKKMAYEFSDSNFDADLGSGQVMLVDLWAEWCGPCLAMSPIVETLATEYEGRALVGKLNVDHNPNLPSSFNVRGIPTFLFFKNGELKAKLVGMQSQDELRKQLDTLLST